jgi:hypothetical protein
MCKKDVCPGAGCSEEGKETTSCIICDECLDHLKDNESLKDADI